MWAVIHVHVYVVGPDIEEEHLMYMYSSPSLSDPEAYSTLVSSTQISVCLSLHLSLTPSLPPSLSLSLSSTPFLLYDGLHVRE